MTNATALRRPAPRAAGGLIDLPVPPLSLPSEENAYHVGERVLITLGDGWRVKAALLAFRPDRGRLFVQIEPQTSVDARDMSFSDIHTVHVLRDRKIVPFSPTLEVRGKVVMPPTRQEFEVILDNEERLSGHTFGFRTDQNGLHLYPGDDSGVYTHVFVSSHAIKTQRVGPLLGKALIEANLVTYEAMKAELAAQHALRAQPIGEYLMSARLVTAKELEAALARQRSTPQVRLGEFLVRDSVVTEAQLAEALRQQEKNRRVPLGAMLVSAGLVSAENIKQVLGKKLGIPFVDLREFAIDIGAIGRVPEDMARRQQVIPLYVQDGRMVIAMENPMQWQVIEALRVHVQMDVEAVMATASDIAWAIDKYYGEQRAEKP